MNTVLSADRPSGEVSTEEMNKLIDLDRYPIDRLDSKAGQLLVARCRSDLDDCAAATCCRVSYDRLRSRIWLEEAESLVQVAHRYDGDSGDIL